MNGEKNRETLPSEMLIRTEIWRRRLIFGFTVGEAVAWLGFHVSWTIILFGLYYFSGQFALPDFLSQKQFLQTQCVILLVKAILIIPYWRLFFITLKKVPLWYRLILHIIMGASFTAVAIVFIYILKIYLLDGAYPWRAVIGDIYATLIFYFTHFAVFHAYNFWLDTKRSLKNEQRLTQLAHAAELNTLKSQIQPHFLFNTLNSISASVPPEMEKTRMLIASLADIFRYSLRIADKQTVVLQEELDFVRTWLELEKNRFHDRLNFRIEADVAVLATPVPAMILQPIVENALHHGLGKKIGGGTIQVSCKKEDNYVLISVSDTGAGYEGELSGIFRKGVGLRNVNQRLKLLYGEQVQVNRNTEGLSFTFKIPLIA